MIERRPDEPDVAAFKYLLNFRLPPAVRNRVLDALFLARFGEERAFASELYLSWEDACQMQRDGMSVGGHTHRHQALATMSLADQHADLELSTKLLKKRLKPQAFWPFSYPYGKPDSAFTCETSEHVREQGFCCAFSTEVGANAAGHDLYRLRRVDTKDAA